MAEWVPKEQLQAARRADLYSYLQDRHPGDIKRDGNSIRLRCNHSVSIKHGYSGYKDFATGETGNALDCLTKYLGYTLPDAAAALGAYMGDSGNTAARSAQTQTLPKRRFELPPPVTGPYKQLFAYLTQVRQLPIQLVQRLVNDNLLYQERDHANIVFVSADRTFAELRGSNSFKSFHQVIFDPAFPAAFWWFKSNGLYSDADVAFICEGAIDALSLYQLHDCGILPAPTNGLYCSIGGVANQQRIDAIKAGMSAAGCPAVMAVDNDAAGADCRQRNPELPAIVPQGKDWNDDLIAAQ